MHEAADLSALWRLLWALPLVLATGAGVVLILRRCMVPDERRPTQAQRLSVLESRSLSEQTLVHMIEVDGASYLIVESTRQTALQAVPVRAAPAAQVPAKSGANWLGRRLGAAP